MDTVPFWIQQKRHCSENNLNSNQNLIISALDPDPHRSALKTAARIRIRMERFGSGSVIRTFKEVKFQKIVLIKL